MRHAEVTSPEVTPNCSGQPSSRVHVRSVSQTLNIEVVTGAGSTIQKKSGKSVIYSTLFGGAELNPQPHFSVCSRLVLCKRVCWGWFARSPLIEWVFLLMVDLVLVPT